MPISGSGGSVITSSSQLSDGVVTAAKLAEGAQGSSFIICGLDEDSVGQGTWALESLTTTSMFNFIVGNDGTKADADNIIYKRYMAIGTYTFATNTTDASDGGIMKIDIGATEVVSIDTYNASLVGNVVTQTTGINVDTPGFKTITISMDGKNGSSSAHHLRFAYVIATRTGDST